MATVNVVQHEAWINTAFEALNKCRHLCKKKKTEITTDFQHWHWRCPCSRRKTKWTCRVGPNQFENRFIAVDELSSSETLKGLKNDCNKTGNWTFQIGWHITTITCAVAILFRSYHSSLNFVVCWITDLHLHGKVIVQPWSTPLSNAEFSFSIMNLMISTVIAFNDL